jgi:hypothetical protein
MNLGKKEKDKEMGLGMEFSGRELAWFAQTLGTIPRVRRRKK